MSWDDEHGFNIHKLKLKDDYEGKVEATLIKRKAKVHFIFMDLLITFFMIILQIGQIN